MVFRVTGNTVITDDRQFVANTFSVNNDNGTIEILDTSPMVGTVAGFTSGGYGNINIIDKFPFATDTNATDHGDLTQGRYSGQGNSSQTHGYMAGGFVSPPVGNAVNTIDKFAFAFATNATDVGNLLTIGRRFGTVGSSSSVSGYVISGFPPAVNTIQKFPFSADSNATDVGDLTFARFDIAGQSSATDGFSSGGYNATAGNSTNSIERFSFSIDNNASDVGDLTQARQGAAGQSSRTHGYISGGSIPTPSTQYNTIDKFLFSTSVNATNVGDLTLATHAPAGQSSLNNGYASGGTPAPGVNTINKFPFATDTNATDIGDLTRVVYNAAGQQD